MAWIRLEDTFPEHTKVVTAGGDAAWLHVCAMAYCNRNETDGFIPTAKVATLSDRRHPAKLADRLVMVGLWEIDPRGGWMIHDYLNYQPSKADLMRKRDAARTRMQKARGSHDSSEDVRANRERSSQDVLSTPTRPDPTREFSVEQEPSSPVPIRPPNWQDGNHSEKAITVARLYADEAVKASAGYKGAPKPHYHDRAMSTALANPDLERWIAERPTAAVSQIVAWLNGDLSSMKYCPQAGQAS